MNPNDRALLKAKIMAADNVLNSAKGMANAPIITPSGPAVVPALQIMCNALEQLIDTVKLLIDKA
jgi:hypothetical protein